MIEDILLWAGIAGISLIAGIGIDSGYSFKLWLKLQKENEK